MTAPAPVHRIREALEAYVPSDVASRVLFEALGHFDGVPKSSEELLTLVQGPLQGILAEEVGTRDATAALARIVEMLGGAPRSGREEDATTTVPIVSHPVTVLVVASSGHFGDRLAAALGPSRVAPYRASSLERIADLSRQTTTAIVVADATDFAAIETDALAETLSAFPPTVPRVVWAAELPYGQALLRSFERRRDACMALPSTEGIDPLLDLIRSRRT